MSPVYRFFGLAAASVLVTACSLTPEPAPPLAISGDLDAFVEEALAEIGVPAGVSVAVYTPEGVYARGFGLASVTTGEAATADTAFYIASSTKSFNALAMNILHHRGEIDLDATLAEYAPGAPFPAAVHPDEVTLRELLTHTSGISNDPIAFRSAYTGEHTPELLWELLGVSEVNEDAPHGTFEYTNTGYNILTVLTDRELGVDWRDLVDREIIEPAGMTRTTAYMSEAAQGGWSVARPHAPSPDGTGMERVYLEKVDATMQSAGGMVMSANDALLWLELLVNDGAVGGRQIVPAEAVRETRARLAEVDQQFGDYLREDYGLGWYVSSYGGDLMIHHFGGFAGFRAHVSYLPERQTGAAVFTNNSVIGSFLADAVANYAYDRLAGREEGPEARAAIVASLGEQYRAIVGQMAAGRAARAERTWTLTQPLSAYTGVYENYGMGTMTIIVEENTLVAHMGILRATAEPFTAPESIRVELVPFSGDVIVFDVNDAGEVVAANLSGDIRFERRGGL